MRKDAERCLIRSLRVAVVSVLNRHSFKSLLTTHWQPRGRESGFLQWWNTEPNPRPRSSPESVRKPTVPILDHSADLADIRQIGMTANLA